MNRPGFAKVVHGPERREVALPGAAQGQASLVNTAGSPSRVGQKRPRVSPATPAPVGRRADLFLIAVPAPLMIPVTAAILALAAAPAAVFAVNGVAAMAAAVFMFGVILASTATTAATICAILTGIVIPAQLVVIDRPISAPFEAIFSDIVVKVGNAWPAVIKRAITTALQSIRPNIIQGSQRPVLSGSRLCEGALSRQRPRGSANHQRKSKPLHKDVPRVQGRTKYQLRLGCSIILDPSKLAESSCTASICAGPVAVRCKNKVKACAMLPDRLSCSLKKTPTSGGLFSAD